ncbi:hypothetical protein E4U45_000307 [Claviceps purpurea]|nr:hypothetical protein E4U45_000307 [Claviceps purpurea]
MGDRRTRRPDSRQMWDQSDRPPRRDQGRDRDRDRDHDRRRYRSRSRSRDRDRDRDRRSSRSPSDKHARDHGTRNSRPHPRGRDRDRLPRRSASPTSRSPPPTSLPTRPRPDENHKKGRRTPSPRRGPKSSSSSGHKKPHDDGDGDSDGEVEGEGEGEGEDDDQAAMQALMGFGGFGTTKGKKVRGNNAGSVYREKKVEYRQYMNRQGGFNRPLSPGR